MTDLARLRQLVATTDDASDADLLDRFIADRAGPAFAALVRRHGPMVLAVCRRVLRHRQDAEDAFQATFLVLARRAEAVKPRALLGNWLYGVAYRTASGARRAAAVRRLRESQAAVPAGDSVPACDGLTAELREALDRELAALPDAYRAAVVACDLEGLHRRDAAVRLGWSEGTLSSRLARARALLARRLARYGLAVPAAGLAAVAGPVAVAAELAGLTVRFGNLVAVGEAAVAAPVAALMEGTMRTMLLVKLKAVTAAAVVGCAVAVSAFAGWRADAAGTADPTQPEAPKAESPKRAGAKPDKEPPAAPKSDKERIAELERERDRLLKQVAELAARLDKIESERFRTPDGAPRPAETLEPLRAEKVKGRTSALPLPPLTGPNHRDALGAPPAAAAPLPPNTTPETGGVPPPLGTPGLPPSPATPRVPPLATNPPPLLTPPGAVDPFRATPPPVPTTPAGRPAVPSVATPATAAKAVVRVYAVGELAGDDKDGEALVKVVRATVEPKSWGADAGVEYLPGRKVLVVRQTAATHDEVKELLALLRKGASTPDYEKAPNRR